MWLATALAASLYWVDIGEQHALVCPPKQYQQCLQLIPSKLQSIFPATRADMEQSLLRRGAMAMPVVDQQFAGMILWAPQYLPTAITGLWNGQVYQLPLQQQMQLTLWHEMGHLAVKQLQGRQLLPSKLSVFVTEWLADSYLIWRSVRETGQWQLAQQQLDRRNMAVFANIKNFSHWTPLYLNQVVQVADTPAVKQHSFAEWVLPIYQTTTQYNADELAEFSSLLQRLFGMGRWQSLPNYMSWRRPALGRVVQPTLQRVMGQQVAEHWMTQQKLIMPTKR